MNVAVPHPLREVDADFNNLVEKIAKPDAECRDRIRSSTHPAHLTPTIVVLTAERAFHRDHTWRRTDASFAAIAALHRHRKTIPDYPLRSETPGEMDNARHFARRECILQ